MTHEIEYLFVSIGRLGLANEVKCIFVFWI